MTQTRAVPGARVRVVYFVAPSEDFAGIERSVHEIATGLAERASAYLDVHVVYGSEHREAVLDDTAYTKHVLGVDRLLALPPAVRRIMRRLQPDVVVFPQIEAATIGWLSTRGLGIPMFLAHLHGNPIVEEQEGTRRSKLAFAVFRRVIARRIAGVLAVSPGLAGFAEHAIARGARVRYVPNPVRRLPQAVSTTATRQPGPFRFVSVGRLSRQKGQDVLLRALAVAVAAGMPPATVTIVGEGSTRASLEALAADLGVADIVDFVGYTTDPAGHLARADCFVLSSRWEGFGVVLIEALQFGLPLLSADCRFGPADIVVDDRIGRLVPAEDVQALGTAMVEAVRRADSEEDREHRRRFAARFERDVAVEAHLDVLQELATHVVSPRLAILERAQR